MLSDIHRNVTIRPLLYAQLINTYLLSVASWSVLAASSAVDRVSSCRYCLSLHAWNSASMSFVICNVSLIIGWLALVYDCNLHRYRRCIGLQVSLSLVIIHSTSLQPMCGTLSSVIFMRLKNFKTTGVHRRTSPAWRQQCYFSCDFSVTVSVKVVRI